VVVVIKYQWLQEYQKLEEEIEILKWKIRKSEVELERWCDPRDLGKVKITNESNASHLEENIKRDKAFLGEKELSMEALMIMVERFNGLDNQILKMKYIDGMTLDSIADELKYSNSYIYKKHAEVVRTIKFVESLN
jgi:DNA-directed RNA polymerase specialized sigma subunit